MELNKIMAKDGVSYVEAKRISEENIHRQAPNENLNNFPLLGSKKHKEMTQNKITTHSTSAWNNSINFNKNSTTKDQNF